LETNEAPVKTGASWCFEWCSAYLRPTTRFTFVPWALTAPGLGLWPITRPARVERARRMRPTEQCFERIFVFA
jgi:hypothetical protein